MIKVNILGKPKIKSQDQLLSVSLKKSEALFYYIVTQKRVTRGELVSLIWDGVDQSTAKKNLRNCLYRLKKDLGVDVFICPNKNIIELDLAIVEVVGDDEETFLKSYKGKFLEAYELKDSPPFDEWVEAMRQTLNQRYVNLALKLLPELSEKGELEKALLYAETMRQIDEFDEETSRWLMTLYHQMGQFKPLVEEYDRLKSLLEDEMGIAPDKETRQLYYTLINQRLETEDTPVNIYGRDTELKVVKSFLSESKGPRVMVVKGEAGIGKTRLVEEVVETKDDDYLVLKANCYQMESGFTYKPWDDIFSQISHQRFEQIPDNIRQILARVFPSFLEDDYHLRVEHIETLKDDYLQKVICNLFKDFGPVLICFDDLQWMDGVSLKLLSALVLYAKNVKIIGTLRNEYSNPVDRFIKVMSQYKLIETLNLQRFSKEETYRFIDFLATEPLGEETKANIFDESEGNAFFVVEYMNLLAYPNESSQSRFNDLLGARFLGLSPEAVKVTNIAAMFFDEMDYGMLKHLYVKDDGPIIDALQELKERFILREIDTEDDLKYRFTHNKLREYIYHLQPKARQKILHQKIAGILENDLSGFQKDVLIYQKLIYHYKAAGNHEKHLTYYLKYLKSYFDFSHELYPEVSSASFVKFDQRPDQSFKEIALLIQKERENGADIDLLEMQYLHMYGRYLIRQGLYDIGIKKIDSLIGLAQKHKDDDMLFKGAVQRIYHAIQVGDSQSLNHYLTLIEGLTLSDRQKAIVMRLRGIYLVMQEAYVAARDAFERSIELFDALENNEKYLLNIAASYNYISETYRKESAFDLALDYANKAIQICEDHNIMRGVSIFNTNAGIIAYLKEDYETSLKYFERALSYFESIDTLWRRGEAEGYLAMVLYKLGQKDRANQMIDQALSHAQLISHPETLETLDTFKKVIQKS